MRTSYAFVIHTVLAFLILAACHSDSRAADPEDPFPKFRRDICEVIKRVKGDDKFGNYHFVFAVCTAGDNSGHTEAANEIIVRSLNGGLLIDGDKVSFMAFELHNWYDKWTIPFKVGQSQSIAGGIPIGAMPKGSYTAIEERRQSQGLDGGHDVNSMLYEVFERFAADRSLARHTVVIVFKRSYSFQEEPVDQEGRSASGYYFSESRHSDYARLLSNARRMGYRVDKWHVVPEKKFSLDFLARKNNKPMELAKLRVLVYAPNPLTAWGNGKRNGQGYLVVNAVDESTAKLVQGGVFSVDKGSLTCKVQNKTKLPEGTHYLRVQAPGYKPSFLRASVATGVTTEVPVELKRVTPPIIVFLITLAVLGAVLLACLRWKIWPDGEVRRISLPLVWPSGAYVCARLDGKPNRGDLILSNEFPELPNGRLVAIKTFLIPYVMRQTRKTQAVRFARSAALDIPRANGQGNTKMVFNAKLTFGWCCGVERGVNSSPKRGSTGTDSGAAVHGRL